MKNGIYDDYLYINGVQQKAYKVVEFEGAYYFVSNYNKIAKNTTVKLYSVWLTDTDLEAGTYTIDADGKIIVE